MTPEYKLEELRKLQWSKVQWLDDPQKARNFPNSVETKRRERDVLAAVIADYEKLVAMRAEKNG